MRGPNVTSFTCGWTKEITAYSGYSHVTMCKLGTFKVV